MSGHADGFLWTISNITISKNVSCNLAIKLVHNASVAISIGDLQLTLGADATAKASVWPHPTFDGIFSGNADGSNVTAVLSIRRANASGAASLALESCRANVSLQDLSIHGLSVLDPVLDLILGRIKGYFYGSITTALCQTLLRDEVVVGFLEPLLATLSYSVDVPLPSPFDGAALDYHLASAPAIVHPPSSQPSYGPFLDIGLSGEAYDAIGHRHSHLSVPTMPQLSSALDHRHVTVQLSPYPFNTLLWTYYSQGALSYAVTPSMLPMREQHFLNTDFFRHLVPKLYRAYPGRNMSLTVAAITLPRLSMDSGNVALSAHVNLSFAVELPSGGHIPAFTLWTPFEAAVELTARADPPTGVARLAGKVHNVDLKLKPGSSSFGGLLPILIVILARPLNFIVNHVVLPLANVALERGLPFPTFQQSAEGFNVSLALVQPTLKLCEGAVILGADAQLSLRPTMRPSRVPLR